MVEFKGVTPVLRIFDEKKAREFYIEFLGFEIRFEHRFEDGLPLYMGLEKSNITIHLSEHHGDVCPGSHIRIITDDVDSLGKELREKKYKYSRPSAHKTPWGSSEMTITDPFGNKLTFVQETDD